MVAFPGTPPLRRFSWAQFLVDFRVVITFVLICVPAGAQVCGMLNPQTLQLPRELGLLGLGLLSAGLFLRSWAAGVVRKNCGICVVGPYSLCRHPLYAGSFLMMVGFCLLTANLWHWPSLVAVTTVLYVATIRTEERRLAERFGTEWTRYAARTPMIFPRRACNYTTCRWFAINWVRNHEYRAVLTTLTALVLFYWWRSNSF